MCNNETFPISWEEVASTLPRRAKDIQRLMSAMHFRHQCEKVDVSDVTVIADEYFRRARWTRPSNLAATANHCASKGWLTEAGTTKRRKLWRITQKGYSQVEKLTSQQET